MQDRPTAVYRHFNAEGELLYVGLSCSPGKRTKQHANLSDWFTQVADIKIEWHPERTAARRAEASAIITEKPKYNKHHAPKPKKLAVSSFDTKRYLMDYCGSVEGAVYLIGKYFDESPKFAAVQKWFYRNAIPGDWWPVLFFAITLDNGVEPRVEDYMVEAEGETDDVFA